MRRHHETCDTWWVSLQDAIETNSASMPVSSRTSLTAAAPMSSPGSTSPVTRTNDVLERCVYICISYWLGVERKRMRLPGHNLLCPRCLFYWVQ
jgi:hypothetical protein